MHQPLYPLPHTAPRYSLGPAWFRVPMCPSSLDYVSRCPGTSSSSMEMTPSKPTACSATKHSFPVDLTLAGSPVGVARAIVIRKVGMEDAITDFVDNNLGHLPHWEQMAGVHVHAQCGRIHVIDQAVHGGPHCASSDMGAVPAQNARRCSRKCRRNGGSHRHSHPNSVSSSGRSPDQQSIPDGYVFA